MLLAPPRLPRELPFRTRGGTRKPAGHPPKQVSPFLQKLNRRPKRPLQPFPMRGQQTFGGISMAHTAAELHDLILAQLLQWPAAIRANEIKLRLLLWFARSPLLRPSFALRSSLDQFRK